MIEKYHLRFYKAPDSDPTRDMPAPLFEQIRQLLPDLIPEDKEYLPLYPTPSEDPVVLRVLEALQQVGLDLSAPSLLKHASVSRVREYDPADLVSCEYIQPSIPTTLGETAYPDQFDTEGVPVLKAPITPRTRECGMASVSLLVRGKAKAALEKSGLTGLRLARPQVVSKKPLPEEEMAWFVWSEAPMPPMLNLFRCSDRSPLPYRYDPHEPRGRDEYPHQGFLTVAELHYLRQTVQAAGSPDIAITHERYGGPVLPLNRILFSQRAVTFFREELGIALGGRPVHLVDAPHPPVPWLGAFPDPADPRNACPAWVQEIARG